MPEENEADDYEQNAESGKFDEHSKWFYNRAAVGQTGEIKRLFRQLYKNNKDEKKPKCYLISLKDYDESLAPAQLSLEDDGKELVRNLIPPGAVKLVGQERGRPGEGRGKLVSHTFHFEFPPAEYNYAEFEELKPQIQIDYNRLDANGQVIKTKNRPTRVTQKNWKDGFMKYKRKGLYPNSQYKVTFTFTTLAGQGPESMVYYIQTPPCGPPEKLRQASVGPNTALLQWDMPSMIDKEAKIDTYAWILKRAGVVVNKGTETDGRLEATLEKLLPAETYEFTVKATSSKDQAGLIFQLWHVTDDISADFQFRKLWGLRKKGKVAPNQLRHSCLGKIVEVVSKTNQST